METSKWTVTVQLYSLSPLKLIKYIMFNKQTVQS